jgi:DtxR family transcriptional regulator, Mn-dependent transcriptional regulator
MTAAMEDYLKAVYRLQEDGAPVTTQRLAGQLGVSCPSVTSMVKRLHGLGLLSHVPYRGVALTADGTSAARAVVRHHRLLELYLAESLGVPWDRVHAEAERLEHHLSEELEARMDAALGFPTRDPHGAPIPRREGRVGGAGGNPPAGTEPGAPVEHGSTEGQPGVAARGAGREYRQRRPNRMARPSDRH